MTEHTPGPWEACELWVCEENDPGHNVGICRVEKRPGCKANARLIAAAPDMLAELQKVEAFLSQMQLYTEFSCGEHLASVRTAIAKATRRS